MHHCGSSLGDVQILTIQFYTDTASPEFFCHNPNRAGPIKRIEDNIVFPAAGDNAGANQGSGKDRKMSLPGRVLY